MTHDSGIDFVWPGIEPVQAGTCLSENLLRSAESQPYQECFGQELYPTIPAKAAYLFYHLATGHIFGNGNKRTAALCLDAFLLANEFYLSLSNGQVHDLAQGVASSGERGEKFADVLMRITGLIQETAFSFATLQLEQPEVYTDMQQAAGSIRDNPLNRPGHPLAQAAFR